ncbi:MAG: alpha/beta fold hydrolase [Pseudomonadales bacterium]|nr:alpha/beta fold hydrolase [Pseudomonadales bacterium]
MAIENKLYSSDRHTTHYLCSGPEGGVPIIFVHGWPELSLSWRHQIPHFAALGFRVIAPDMRGYGQSSIYQNHGDYAQRHVVADMLELADGLGIGRAIWVGHDWGCATVWNLARHYADRCIAVANLCVPYYTIEAGWDGLLPYINRAIYPEDEYPAGQWEYQCYYEENFAAATAAFDADPEQLISLIFRRGNPDGRGQVAGTAMTRKEGGWFGGGAMPELPNDPVVVSVEEVKQYAESLRRNSFFGPDSYYMNHDANAAYTAEASSHVLDMPVLFLHGRYDYTCETIESNAVEPMRQHCSELSEAVVDSGHWMAQEKPEEVNKHLSAWIQTGWS